MLHKILKSLIYCLLFLSAHSISYAEDIEPREADQAVTIHIYNYSGLELILESANLAWGRWGYTPESSISSMTTSLYSIKGTVTSGPQATNIYNVTGTSVELMVYVNSNHFSPTKFDSKVCLRLRGKSECLEQLNGYRVGKVERFKVDSNVLHHLDVYIKNVNYLPFESLCANGSISRTTPNELIDGIIALDGDILNIKNNEKNRFYGAFNRIINMYADNITGLDLINTSYLAGMRVTHCTSSNGDDLDKLIIHK